MKLFSSFMIISLLFCHSGFAQVDSTTTTKPKGFESYKQAGQKDFNEYKKSQQQAFDDYKRKNDSIFQAYLRGEWKTYDAVKSEHPSYPKPKDPPVFEAMQIMELEIKPFNMEHPDRPLEKPGDLPPQPAEPPGASKETFDFYGTPVEIIKGNDTPPSLPALSPSMFDAFFKQAIASPVMEYNAACLYSQAKKIGLNDWGLVQITNRAAANFFTSANEKVLFIWYVLLRNGYIVKAGYNFDKIFLMVSSEQALYTFQAEIDGRTYYLLPVNNEKITINQLDSYSGDYPHNKTGFSLISGRLPSFQAKPVNKTIGDEGAIEISVDKNILDYLSSFPDCDLSVSFSVPFSEIALSSLVKSLQDKMKGMTDPDKVEYLLHFVQGLPYKNDLDQFGSEKFMFAEQALFFPFTDCEDRSVLLARLILTFTPSKVIGLQYSDHVAIGVNFDSFQLNGAFVKVDGLKYYYCDPTYMKANPGMIPENYREAKPILIFFN